MEKFKEYSLFKGDSNNQIKEYKNLKNYEFKNNSSKNDTKLAATDSLGIRIPYKYKRKFTLDYYGAQYQYDLIQNEGQGVGYFYSVIYLEIIKLSCKHL